MLPLVKTEKKLERREQNRTVGMGINHFLTKKHCFPIPIGAYTGRSRGYTGWEEQKPRGGGLSDPGPLAWMSLTHLAVPLLGWMQMAQLKG